MPVAALSLAGFLDAARASEHLANECFPPDPTAQGVALEWNSAKQKLGSTPVVPNAGKPIIQALPSPASGHIQQLGTLPWAIGLFGTPSLSPAEFKLVEVDALIAFQLTVNKERAQHHCGSLGSTPTLQEMLDICFPLQPATEQFRAMPGFG